MYRPLYLGLSFIVSLRIFEQRAELLSILRRLPLLVPTFRHECPSSGFSLMKHALFPLKNRLHGCIGPGQFFVARGTFNTCHQSYESMSLREALAVVGCHTASHHCEERVSFKR